MVGPTAPSDVAETRGMDTALDEELQVLQSAGLRRTLRQVHQRRAGTVLLNGERIADFASNDYLGLASDPRLARAATAVLQAEGVGAGAARLISGNHPLHEALERARERLRHLRTRAEQQHVQAWQIVAQVVHHLGMGQRSAHQRGILVAK